MIFLIQSYSLYDGPGIRTTVFMKGCPLACRWCHNPESWDPFPELMTHDDRCIRCGKCLNVCTEGAITVDDIASIRTIDRNRCTRCFECVSACPADALDRVGAAMSADQVLAEIEKDELFHINSGGGITLSGGEPLLQPEFTIFLLKACKDRGWHTALDTSGCVSWSVMEAALSHVDLLLFDIKHLHPEAHLKATGKSNALLLKNLRRAASQVRVWLRIPLIPGYNDTDENLKQVGELGKEITAEKISVLPFNQYGEGKHENLGKKRPYRHIEPDNMDRIKEVKQRIEKLGLKVSVGE